MTKLNKLKIQGFGRFEKEFQVTFNDGINFIHGQNETGKSTLLEAILASIFKYQKKYIDPFFNWKNQDICRIALSYTIENGESYQISCDYIANQRVLDKIENGENVEISGADKVINPKLKEHFGFDDKKVFENTAFIRQSQMTTLSDDMVKNKIKKMMEEVLVGSAESSATEALRKIQGFIKKSKKEVKLFEESKDELEEKLEKADETRDDMAMQSEQFEKVSSELAKAEKKLEKLQRNKKLFDEKNKLIEDKHNFEERIRMVDELLDMTTHQNKPRKNFQTIISIVLLFVGAISLIAGFILQYPLVGGIAGIFFIILAIILFLLGRMQGENSVTEDVIEKNRNDKKDLMNGLIKIESKLDDEKIRLVNFTLDEFEDLDTFDSRVKELTLIKQDLASSIKITKKLTESPEEINESLQVVIDKINDLTNKIEEHELASEFLEQAENNVRQKYTPSMEKDAQVILKKITNGKYSELEIDEQSMDVRVRAPETGQLIEASSLSQGASDQLYFALRTVMANLLSAGSNIPLILDDPFHNFDEVRLAQTIMMLKEISKSKQVIIISHRPYDELFPGFAGNVVNLK